MWFEKGTNEAIPKFQGAFISDYMVSNVVYIACQRRRRYTRLWVGLPELGLRVDLAGLEQFITSQLESVEF